MLRVQPPVLFGCWCFRVPSKPLPGPSTDTTPLPSRDVHSVQPCTGSRIHFESVFIHSARQGSRFSLARQNLAVPSLCCAILSEIS